VGVVGAVVGVGFAPGLVVGVVGRVVGVVVLGLVLGGRVVVVVVGADEPVYVNACGSTTSWSGKCNTTSYVPGTACAVVSAVIHVGSTTLTFCSRAPSISTVARSRCGPRIVTGVPPSVGPLDGESVYGPELGAEVVDVVGAGSGTVVGGGAVVFDGAVVLGSGGAGPDGTSATGCVWPLSPSAE
jgi:hypothetical protein